MTQPQTEMVEKVAQALYEHWVSECVEDDWAGWGRLRDKDTWRSRARSALASIAPDIEELVVALGRCAVKLRRCATVSGNASFAVDGLMKEFEDILSKFTNTKGNDRG